MFQVEWSSKPEEFINWQKYWRKFIGTTDTKTINGHE